MAFGRLKEAISSGLSAGREALSCVPNRVDSCQRSFSRALLFSIGLLAAGSGCRSSDVDQGGWDGDSDVYCDSDYFDIYVDQEQLGSHELASFGAMTDNYDWPEDAYPLGYIDSNAGNARVFLNTGPWVEGTEIAVAGFFLGSSYADEDSISKYSADYVSFCEDGSFIVSVYDDFHPSGKKDLQVVGRTIRPMENLGEAFTMFNQYTVLYESQPVEEVPSAGQEGATEVPSFYDFFPPNQIAEVRVGQMKNDGSMTIHQVWDALGQKKHTDMIGFRTY